MASNQYKSIIELFAGCPFSINNEHTLEPMSISSKLTWLENNCTFNRDSDRFETLMYVRCDSATNRGTFRLACLDLKAYDYNYAYIHNIRGSTYFAYITGCRYINDGQDTPSAASKGVYEFDFTLDLLMTNLHSADQLKPCYVVRQHSATDLINENYVPEPVNIVSSNIRDTIDLGASISDRPDYDLNYPGCAVFGLIDPDESNIIDRVVSGFSLRCFYENDPYFQSSMREFLKPYATSEDVKFGFMVPWILVDHFYDVDFESTDPKGHAAPIIKGKTAQSIVLGPMPQTDTVSGYTPKNKKLLTYPYKYILLSDGNGHSVAYRHEMWAGRQNEFWELDFSIFGSPAIRITPLGYANQNVIKDNNEYVLTISGFPMINWSCSAWDTWVSSSFTGKVTKAIGELFEVI